MKVRTIGVLSLVGAAVSLTPYGRVRLVCREVCHLIKRAAAVIELQAREGQVGRRIPIPQGPALTRYMDKRAQLQDLISRI